MTASAAAVFAEHRETRRKGEEKEDAPHSNTTTTAARDERRRRERRRPSGLGAPSPFVFADVFETSSRSDDDTASLNLCLNSGTFPLASSPRSSQHRTKSAFFMDDKPGIVVAAAKSAIDDAPRCRWCRRLSKVHFQRPFPKNAAVEKHFRIERDDDDDDDDDDAGFPRALVVVLLIIAFVLVFPDVEAHRANRAR